MSDSFGQLGVTSRSSETMLGVDEEELAKDEHVTASKLSLDPPLCAVSVL